MVLNMRWILYRTEIFGNIFHTECLNRNMQREIVGEKKMYGWKKIGEYHIDVLEMHIIICSPASKEFILAIRKYN